MQILFLTQIVPYPPDAGPKVKTWHVIRHLAEAGHEISLATFVRPDEYANLEPLRKICAHVFPIPLNRSHVKNLWFLFISLLNKQPFLVARDNIAEMQTLVNRLVDSGSIDVVHTDQFTMAQFARGLQGKVPRIFDSHNAMWKLVERTIENYPLPIRIALRNEKIYMMKYEHDIIQSFDHTFTVTKIDRDFLLELFAPSERPAIAAKITDTPISVDCDVIQPITQLDTSFEIVTLGTLHYPPNADGIRWFLNEVFPLILPHIPQAHLTIIGKNPPDDFIQEAQRIPLSVTITGYVPDLLPYFQKAALVVIPVRSGSGMRVRILEAFAYGLPAVTTTVGLEGIEAQPDRDVIVADDPQTFANAVIRLLEDTRLRHMLAANGRALAEQKYHWQKVLTMMDPIYDSIALKQQHRQQ
jgi:glycosyltransferase involved in cell wall biosynthesis